MEKRKRGRYANHIMVNRAWESTIAMMSDMQKAEALEMIFAVGNGEEYTPKDASLAFLFNSWAAEIRQNNANYNEACENRSRGKMSEKSAQQEPKPKPKTKPELKSEKTAAEKESDPHFRGFIGPED